MVICYLILQIMFRHIIIHIFITLSLIPLILTGHMSRIVIKSIRGSTFLFFFIVFFNTLFVSFNFGIQLAIRFMNIIITFSLLFHTTNPDDLSQVFTKMGVPFHVAFSLSLAFRFVPTIALLVEGWRCANGWRKGSAFRYAPRQLPFSSPRAACYSGSH